MILRTRKLVGAGKYSCFIIDVPTVHMHVVKELKKSPNQAKCFWEEKKHEFFMFTETKDRPSPRKVKNPPGRSPEVLQDSILLQ